MKAKQDENGKNSRTSLLCTLAWKYMREVDDQYFITSGSDSLLISIIHTTLSHVQHEILTTLPNTRHWDAVEVGQSSLYPKKRSDILRQKLWIGPIFLTLAKWRDDHEKNSWWWMLHQTNNSFCVFQGMKNISTSYAEFAVKIYSCLPLLCLPRIASTI